MTYPRQNTSYRAGIRDPNFGSVIFLSHLDAKVGNNVTSIVGPSPGVLSGGSANIDGTIQLFGPGCLINTTGSGGLLTYNPGALFLGGALTFECWVRASTSSYGTVFQSDVGTLAGGSAASVNILGSGQVQFSFHNSTITTVGSVPLTTWTAIAFTIDAPSLSTARVYINGLLDKTTINFGVTGGSCTQFALGNNLSNTNGFAGRIDDVRISNFNRYIGASYTLPTAAFPDG